MTIIAEIRFPEEWDCTVRGYFYDSNDRRDLGQDMIEVSLPNGILVTGGWIPDGDPSGNYQIEAWHGLNRVSGPISAKTVNAAYDVLAHVVDALRKDVLSLSDADDYAVVQPQTLNA